MDRYSIGPADGGLLPTRKAVAQVAERKRRHGKLYLLLMALAAAGAAIWVGSSVLSVEEFAFTGARLPAGWDGGRLVVLSDLHGKRFGRQHSRLLEAVRGPSPTSSACAAT